MLMLALLLFPMAEKVLHELGHLDDEHCEIQSTHFCKQEHNCSVCDYVFSSSSSAISPNEQEQLIAFSQDISSNIIGIISNTTTSLKNTLPLRGPPIA